MTVRKIIKSLSELDLSSYPRKEAITLIESLGKYGCMSVNLHPGKILMRARPNSNEEIFTHKDQLSYKPQEFNKTYQRASTPDATMFYATAIPENVKPDELNNLRVVGVFESLPWMRDKTQKGYKRISFGKWQVTKDIKLLAIVQHKDYYEKSSYTRELVDAFQQFIKEYPDMEEKTTIISDFFALQFAKEDIANDFDYLLSALYSELAIKQGFDGVFYPSVRTQGQGFNIALKPEIAKNNLELLVAGECSLYKYLDHTVLDNDTIAELKPNQVDFTLSPVNPKYHAGKDECLKQLGLKKIEDLYNVD